MPMWRWEEALANLASKSAPYLEEDFCITCPKRLKVSCKRVKVIAKMVKRRAKIAKSDD